MKYHKNNEETNSYFVRSDINHKLTREIEREHQIDEIKERMPDLKRMLKNQIKLADNLGMCHTVEFEEANRKLMEMKIVDEKLDETKNRIRKERLRLNICIGLTILLALLMFIMMLQYCSPARNVDLDLAQKQAEKVMLEYNINMIDHLKKDADAHTKVV